MEHTTSIAVPTLQQHMLKTYLWMALGLLVSFFIAFTMNVTGIAIILAYQFPFMLYVVLFGQLGLVFFFSAFLMKMKVLTAKICYLVYVTSFGVFLSYVTLVYEVSAIILALVSASLLFVSLAVIGTTTKMDLTKLGTICFAGLIASLLFSIFAAIMHIPYSTTLFAFLGLLIFMGFTAYDSQRCIRMYEAYQDDAEKLRKLSIYSAFDLYVDFMGMFLRLLQIFSRD